MIEGKFIRSLAQTMPVKAEALEKDYVMNLILDALARCDETKEAFFFKGGSCIYKCFYHENNHSMKGSYHPVTGRFLSPKDRTKAYLQRVRLSKDLDLTVRPDMMNEDKLKSAFSAVGAYLKEKHGLEIGGFSFPIHENLKQKINGHYKKNCRGELWFKGPMFNDKFSPPRLKLDLTADESVVFQPYQKSLAHPYEDVKGGLIANTYTFRDVFAEKFRSLFERCSAHDLFDIAFLADHSNVADEKRKLGIGLAIIEKFRIKNIPLSLDENAFLMRFEKKELIDTKATFKKNWENTMRREKSEGLMSFEEAWICLENVLEFGRHCVKTAMERLNAYQVTHPHVDLNTAFKKLNMDLDRDISNMRGRETKLKKLSLFKPDTGR